MGRVDEQQLAVICEVAGVPVKECLCIGRGVWSSKVEVFCKPGTDVMNLVVTQNQLGEVGSPPENEVTFVWRLNFLEAMQIGVMLLGCARQQERETNKRINSFA